ncbi:MAG TPA: hypothetical protein VIC34_09095 [Croceibacterium sp.]
MAVLLPALVSARAQQASAGIADAAPASSVQTADGSAAEITIPALTPIVVELLADEGSGISKSGDTFPLRLAEPIQVAGRAVIPAGTPGIGEVIHAKKSGGGGSGGELILAADYLELDGRHLPLRSLDLAEVGKNNYRTADSLGLAGAATSPAVALIGMFIKGKQITVPKGTRAAAKTAAAFTLSAAPAQSQESAGDAPAVQNSTGGVTQ